MKKMRNILCIIALSLSSCVTPYKRQYIPDGTNVQKIINTHYLIRYNGDASLTLERATDYCLLRSSEVTIESGFSHFVIKSLDASNYVGKTSESYIISLIKSYNSNPYIEMRIILENNENNERNDVGKIDAVLIKSEIQEKYGIE